MWMKKTGLAALVVACALGTVTAAADAKPTKVATAKKARAKKTTAASSASASAATSAPASPSSSASASASTSAPTSAATLPVDCSKSDKDRRCQRASSAAGTIGSGPAIQGSSGFPSIGGGFIDGNRLVAAVEMGSQYDDQGGLFAFDLDSGNRTLLSGKIESAATGPVTVGSGPDLGNVRSVAQSAGQWFAVVSKGSTQPTSIVRVDPKTGNRTAFASFDGTQKCAGSTAKLNVDAGSIAVGPDGTAYLSVGNMSNAVGIIAVKSGGACSIVTMSGAGGFETKGTGPTIESLDHYASLTVDGGKLWALHGMSNSLMTIDLATGNRARVSSGESSTRVGPGDVKMGYTSLALAGGKVWTVGSWGGSSTATITEVATSNGARTGHDTVSGPVSRDAPTGVWVHPTKPFLVLVVDDSLVLYDPKTFGSTLLSD